MPKSTQAKNSELAKAKRLLPLPSVNLGILLFLPLVLLNLLSPGKNFLLYFLVSIVLLLASIDLYLSWKEPLPEVSRQLPRVWPIGLLGKYLIVISNPLRRVLNIVISEDSSANLQKTLSHERHRIPAHGARVVAVRFLASVRGNLHLGPVYLRYPSILHLWLLSMAVDWGDFLRIYPDVRDYIGFEPFEHRKLAYQLGQRKMKLQGEGTEFDSLREYQPGDDYKAFNWKATARLGKPVVTVSRVEQDREIIILLDSGRNMFTDISGRSRFDRYLDAVVQINYAAQLENDRVGLLVFDEKVRLYMPPAKRTNLLAQIYHLQPVHLEADFENMFAFFTSQHPKRSFLFVLTDITDSVSGEKASAVLKKLSERNQVILAILDDPKILSITREIPKDEEEFFQQVGALSYLKRRHRLCAELSKMGVDVVRTSGERLSLELVNRYLRYKALLRL